MKQDPLRNSPNSAFDNARAAWFENYGSSIVEKRRYFLLAVLLLVALAGQSVAIMSLLPLKTIVPYVISVEQGTGRVEAREGGAQLYEPGKAEKQYFIAQWAIKLLSLDRFTTERALSDAYRFTRDKAVGEFTQFVNIERPIERLGKNPNVTRVVTIRSISFIQEGAAIVRLQAETHEGGTTGKQVKSLVLTIHYSLVPPQNDKEILENPIGFYVTHFAINEDLT